jgi:hypothetical protein
LRDKNQSGAARGSGRHAPQGPGIAARVRDLPALALLTGVTLCLSSGDAAADWLGDLMPSFAESELQFQRSDSNVPFLPVASLSATHYNDLELTADGVTVGSFDQTTVSQGAGVTG